MQASLFFYFHTWDTCVIKKGGGGEDLGRDLHNTSNPQNPKAKNCGQLGRRFHSDKSADVFEIFILSQEWWQEMKFYVWMTSK